MAKQILIMRGPEDRLPSKLAEGELAFCLDSKKLFIGGSAENVLLADGNVGGDSSAAYVYKCTGTDDNVVICQIVESFLSTNDGVQNLKLCIEGVAGINQTAFGDGSDVNPYYIFYLGYENPYGKTVVLDGGNCTFPKANYSVLEQGYYFAIAKTIHLENISVEIEGFGHVTAFYHCSKLTNCTGTAICKNENFGIGFSNCNNLTNCTGTGNGHGDSYAYGYGFSRCSNLINCTGVGTGNGSDYGYCFGCGFRDCSSLTDCTGTGFGRSDNSASSGFRDCKRLNSCKGYGYSIGNKGVGFHWDSSTSLVAQMVNCTAPRKTKSGYTQDYGILLDGTTDGAKYCLIGNTIAPDSGGFVGIKKHTKTGSEYTETGTIRASVE